MTEKGITELFLKRDLSAMEQVNELYGNDLFCIAQNIVSNEKIASEAVDDGIFKAWNIICNAESVPDNLKAFLLRLVRQSALERMVGNSTKRKTKEGNFSPIYDLEKSGISKNADASEVINVFVNSLSPVLQAVFVKRFFYFESESSIAQSIDTSAKYVKKAIKQICLMLKDNCNVLSKADSELIFSIGNIDANVICFFQGVAKVKAPIFSKHNYIPSIICVFVLVITILSVLVMVPESQSESSEEISFEGSSEESVFEGISTEYEYSEESEISEEESSAVPYYLSCNDVEGYWLCEDKPFLVRFTKDDRILMWRLGTGVCFEGKVAFGFTKSFEASFENDLSSSYKPPKITFFYDNGYIYTAQPDFAESNFIFLGKTMPEQFYDVIYTGFWMPSGENNSDSAVIMVCNDGALAFRNGKVYPATIITDFDELLASWTDSSYNIVELHDGANNIPLDHDPTMPIYVRYPFSIGCPLMTLASPALSRAPELMTPVLCSIKADDNAYSYDMIMVPEITSAFLESPLTITASNPEMIFYINGNYYSPKSLDINIEVSTLNEDLTATDYYTGKYMPSLPLGKYLITVEINSFPKELILSAFEIEDMDITFRLVYMIPISIEAIDLHPASEESQGYTK